MNEAIQHIRRQLTSLFPEQEINSLTSRIVCHVCHLQTVHVLSCKDKKLSENERHEIESIVERLLHNEPLQYILGETEFYGLPFAVDSSVLIPRPETEELVDWVVRDEKPLKSEGQPNSLIVDIGTGSGCIAVTLAKYLPEALIYGIDISADALSVAKKNAGLNQVEVQWIQGDILARIPPVIPGTPDIDIIISNPPYIVPSEKKDMEKNVLDYEPSIALFVPEQEPLLFYEAIADAGIQCMQQGGRLYFEINAAFGRETCEMLKNKGYQTIELRQDISGKDRMIKAVR